MTAILERRESESLWGRFCNWITIREESQKEKEERMLSVSASPHHH
jgi:hypothetical protein